MSRLLFLLAALLISLSPCPARIIRVADTGDGTNGQTWATAFRTVNAALVNAASGDQIWVKEGRYHEAIRLKDGVSLLGGFAGVETDEQFEARNPAQYLTILDATGSMVSTVSAEHVSSVVLEGWTIMGGGGGFRRRSCPG